MTCALRLPSSQNPICFDARVVNSPVCDGLLRNRERYIGRWFTSRAREGIHMDTKLPSFVLSSLSLSLPLSLSACVRRPSQVCSISRSSQRCPPLFSLSLSPSLPLSLSHYIAAARPLSVEDRKTAITS